MSFVDRFVERNFFTYRVRLILSAGPLDGAPIQYVQEVTSKIHVCEQDTEIILGHDVLTLEAKWGKSGFEPVQKRKVAKRNNIEDYRNPYPSLRTYALVTNWGNLYVEQDYARDPQRVEKLMTKLASDYGNPAEIGSSDF